MNTVANTVKCGSQDVFEALLSAAFGGCDASLAVIRLRDDSRLRVKVCMELEHLCPLPESPLFCSHALQAEGGDGVPAGAAVSSA